MPRLRRVPGFAPPAQERLDAAKLVRRARARVQRASIKALLIGAFARESLEGAQAHRPRRRP